MGDSAKASTSVNRAGMRDGRVSELTVIAPLKKGGADRLRGLFASRGGRFEQADRVGTVHNMRFLFLDNDTKMLFAATYDGDWDTYIEAFATTIPEAMDLIFSELEGWPGIHAATVKDFIAQHQITAAAWYVAFPEASVADLSRSLKVRAAFDNLLDAAGN